MMNRATKQLFAFMALAFATGAYAAAVTTATTQSLNVVANHPSSVNVPLEMVAYGHGNGDNDDSWAANFAVAGWYSHNWNQNDAATNPGSRWAWAADKSNVMTVGATSKDLNLAGLGSTGTMTVDPKIYTAGAHFMLNVAASATEPGFFGMINAPVGVISIDPNVTLATLATADQTILTNYFNGTSATGLTAQTVALANGLLNGKVNSGAQFGDINAALGYNFIQDEDKHLGVALRGTFATAKKSTGVQALEPVFGNNGHHALGGSICGAYQVWENDGGDSSVVISLAGNVQHMFKSTAKRTFDFLATGAATGSSKGSKYGLIAVATSGALTTPFANVSTIDAETSRDVFGDVAVKVAYRNSGWDAQLGYNFFGESAEKLTITGTVGTSFGVPGTTSATAVTNANLDAVAATQKASYSSKIFAAAGYTWEDTDYCPYVRAAGDLRLSHVDNDAIPTWGVSVIGGVTF